MARDILDLGADVIDDTIVQSKHRISPKKRNYIIGLSITGLLLVGTIAFTITAANLWLQDMDYVGNIQFYFTPKDANDPNAPEPTLTLYKLDPNTKYQEDFRIPERVNGYKVTAIAPEAFNGHTEIKKIRFTRYIDTVGEKAFYGLKDLSEIKWNKALSYIGPDAFGDTAFYNNLKKDPKGFYRIPSGVLIYLGTEYFNDNTVLVDDHLSETERNNIKAKYGVSDENFYSFGDLNVINFTSGLFQNNQKIVYVDLPSFLDEIGAKTFYNCTNLKGVGFTNSNVTTIEESAFQNCSSLKDITFSNKLTTVGNYAFAHTAIEEIPALSNITTMGIGIFQGCTSLAEVIYPASENFTTVPENIFADCTSLSTIYWGDTSNSDIDYVNYIAAGAFQNTAFVTFTVPKNVPAILDNTFNGCDELKEVIFYANQGLAIEEESVEYDEEGNVIYDNEVNNGSYTFNGSEFVMNLKQKDPINATKASDGSLEIVINDPDGDLGLSSVTFKLTAQEVTALQNLEDLYIVGDQKAYQLNLSGGLAYLSTTANYYILDDGTTGVGNLKGVKDIRSKAFMGCTSLETISLYDDNYAKLASCEDGTFTFPQTLKTTDNDSYNQNVNKNFQGAAAKKIKISANTRTIGSYAFSDMADLESVEFASNSMLKSIGPNAFEHDVKLTSVSFPKSLTTLGSYAFSGCENLVSVDFANSSVKTIGAGLFYNCKKLAHVDLPETVNNIRSDAFYGVDSLDYIIIPKEISQINANAFVGNLRSDDTRLPIYFQNEYANRGTNIASDFYDSTGAYDSYLLGATETKVAGRSYWLGDVNNPVEILLTDLASEGTLEKTEYAANEVFNPAGLTITASYDDSTSLVLNAAKDIVWETLTSGMTSINGTYTVGNVTKTVTISGITVA